MQVSRSSLQVAVVVLGILVIAIAGYAVYQEYLLYEGANTTKPNTTVSSATSNETSPSDTAAVLIHEATPENISANSTYLDHPSANNNPNVVLQITQNWNPGTDTGIYNDHSIGVWYDTGRQRWAIFNQDRAAIPEGASFNVSVFNVSEGPSQIMHPTR